MRKKAAIKSLAQRVDFFFLNPYQYKISALFSSTEVSNYKVSIGLQSKTSYRGYIKQTGQGIQISNIKCNLALTDAQN